jgi:precorrin-3B synthase
MRRGWCPGALRPMETGDGLLVRVRPPGGRLTARTCRALAEAAVACGNGAIDLSARANLQLRGVREASLPDLHARLDALGLLDPGGAEAEARRNVLAPPLAGDDPSAWTDVRGVAAAAGERLATDPALAGLPAKFAVVVDDGGAVPLDDVGADVRLLAVAPDRFALVLDGAGAVAEVAAPDAAEAVTLAAAAFLEVRGEARRMRECAAAVADALRLPRTTDPASRLRGAEPGLSAPIRLRAGVAVAVGVPYGRLDAATLAALADLAETFADGTLRPGPRRLLFVAGATPHGAAAFRAAAEALGLVVHADDPRRRVEACPGAPACASAHGGTRDLADRLAPLVPEGRTLHVSGCAKGCARPDPADLTLVRRPGGGVALVERGRASDPPARTGTEADLPAWIAEHAA